eukprot:CAMPEP_0173462842 /NCGR_PEP_ID=MMETSP1357-20121228/67317_1 /TAXON_ID=77926 /ORGANISM="Hemiselmis rufescens, Strain PCC563" /LENGTH=130 /DNA_ID=CAMNT_0014430601 /DNA_START=5 /DNA_END=397 /DNA_ORIENTATION=+
MTIAGALPPSSRLTFVMLAAAFRMILCPVATLPVIEMMSGTLLTHRASPTVDPLPVSTATTPGSSTSSPALMAWDMRAVKRKAVSGVSSEDLTTTVHPASRAGAILRAMTKKGKFQGQIPTDTPMAALWT